ncbi:MFS transporter [Cellulomonas fimi]|uniref:Major facilitator superfamily MFS_1 n=1 Tax=Cellulomonas fimi (strain ATCC 484 / DSM 20113 / JCM 1341 / CCUG 24087 / LMG 16345 / NBRC 15513 / NCIMB 8980 / NCTC 7547 / NRS-133) TaxID=590998 RepID=F4H2P9_CELFA|nr:MFS transporter [Cellulomonas fimi]AEE45275.1 major facilitator superfamily MFS_1 [Cellulomonas fimi ATCC 484]NNH08020.1 MFS transporter [Cellulomonas fimi]VEH28780.1 Putative bacilysin exporter BacE [Cellulomonas fimi]
MSTAPPPAEAPPAPRRSLVHHPDFRRLWTGDALGQLGAQLTGIALPVLAVQNLAATEWEMGVLTAAETLAFLVIGLPAGAWVDRMRKRDVLVVADVVRGTVLAVVVAAALTGHASMPLLIGAALVVSVASTFFDVAHQSYVPWLVGLDHVVEGNSKLQSTQSVAMVVAPAVAGALLRVVTAPLLIAANVVTYLLSAFAVSRIRHREQPPAPETRRPLRAEIAEGLRFVVRQPLLRRIVACTGIGNLFGSATGALGAIYALRVLGLDTAAFGTVLSAGAIGGLVGAVAADRLSRLVGEARIIPVSALLFVPAAALPPLAAVVDWPPQVLLIAGGALFSFAVVVYNVAQVSFRQRLCPPALLGRMNASVRFFVWGTMPLGGLLGGWLGTTIGVVPTLWVGVAGVFVSALPVVLSPLVRMDELPRPDSPAVTTDGKDVTS